MSTSKLNRTDPSAADNLPGVEDNPAPGPPETKYLSEVEVEEAGDRAVRRKRNTLSVELAVLGGLTVVVYGLAARFDWFETLSDWIQSNHESSKVDEIAVAMVFFMLGLLIFAFRRWRESETEVRTRQRMWGELRLLNDELDHRVKQRTAELHKANDARRAEFEDHLRADEALCLQSEALMAAANAIVITDREGTVVWVNRAFCALTGYTPAEAVGRNPRDLVKSSEQDRTAYKQLWETILSGRVWQGELVNRRKDGSRYVEEQTITPVRDANGEITHFIAIKQDLTDRKRADEMVQQSRRQFQAVFEQAAVGMVIAEGPRGQFVDVNHRFCEMVGYTADELRQMASHDITHPDDVATDTEQLAQISAGTSRGFSREKRYRRKDGSYVWARAFVAPLDPSEARPTRRIGVIEDLSGRKQAEEALRQSEERYRLFFENNPLAMWLYDLETLRFLAVNESAIQHYGYTRAEFLGMTIKQIRPEEDIAALVRSVQESTREAPGSGEWRHRRKDGTIIHVEVISRSLMYAGREARLVLAADITEKKLLEEKFLHAQRLESIGMLAAGIAHDLNNVLAPIVFAGPMLRDSLSSEQDLKILNTLEASAGRGAGLVKQILGFVHSATGQFRTTQVKHLARDIANIMEETFPKSIELAHQIPSDLWPVYGDPTQIHQVLLNLCINARDAMPEGGTLRVAVSNRQIGVADAAAIPGGRPGAWLVIEVADTGTGIPAEVLAHIWDPFFTTKGAGKGTGLGLSTVRGIVASHHGFITVETQLGRGTTFRVFLPAADEKSAGVVVVPSFAAPVGNSELILVVDDDASIRESITAVLTKHNYRVLSAGDGVEAVEHFSVRSTEIALVITDVDMPRLGGAALAGTLAKLRPELPLLVISGLSRSETDGAQFEAARELARAFLLKPFPPEVLLKAVNELVHPPAKV